MLLKRPEITINVTKIMKRLGFIKGKHAEVPVMEVGRRQTRSSIGFPVLPARAFALLSEVSSRKIGTFTLTSEELICNIPHLLTFLLNLTVFKISKSSFHKRSKSSHA